MKNTEKIKSVMLISALGATLSASGINAQEISPRDSLKAEIKSDIKNAQLIMQMPQAYIDAQQLLQEQYNTQVKEDTLSLEETRIGPFTGKDVLVKNSYEKYKENEDIKPAIIHRDVQNLGFDRANEHYESVASCSDKDTINIPKWNIAPKYREAMMQVEDAQAYLMLGNNFAEILTYYHENVHHDHVQKGQISVDSKFHPVDRRISSSIVTEKIAKTCEYFVIANYYNFFKQNGIETIQSKGKSVRTDDIIGWFPGLRDFIKNNGFHPESPEYIMNMTQLASEYWDKENFSGYRDIQFSQNVTREDGSIMGKIQAARDIKKISQDMMKDIKIGLGLKIDFPPECIDMFYPDSNKIKRIVSRTEILDIMDKEDNSKNHKLVSEKEKSLYACVGGLIKIDDYLSEIGLKNDSQKEKYLKTQFEKIVHRTPDADKKLAQLMLNCQYSSTVEPMIVYSDNIILYEKNGHKIIYNSNETVRTALSDLDKTLEKPREKSLSKDQNDNKTFDASPFFTNHTHSR